ncbi:unnamed protein product, partial [Brenthis ino]
KTIIVAIGYLDSTNFPIAAMFANEYEARGYNVILVDNQRFATVHYFLATRLMRPVGKHVAEILVQLTHSGLDPAKTELLGFSLGGQTISYIAKNYQQMTGTNISRITALEPAGPCFRTLSSQERLDASNADFVQVLHTNIDGFGMATRMGHVDFYINGGEYQPSDINFYPCSTICSHFSILPLWLSVMKNPDKFIGIKCNNIQEARDAACYNNIPLVTNVMGDSVDINNHGIFYVSTDKAYPYYLGKKGLKQEYASWRRISDINSGNETEVFLLEIRWFLLNCSIKDMSTTGLKHVATEPSRLESKRERRRGAAGRAAALRRAPSDSDCSGETASLSADSGDRSVRPAPPPPRSGKNRNSRRRGSEWEVLEGLKDGQRFDKRPEVFNGYLHKKRKWPLKGWHKRFFVVDGGILVYARSPTDVARGRLHGSVDVGLSVISAKARRRRIDIDADEFIYHLRAKTPDVFRTWLNVLKAHRLYRQHLLTFGARESVPKIHAPLEDLPITDTSSHISRINITNSPEDLKHIWNNPCTLVYPVSPLDPNFNQMYINDVFDTRKEDNSIRAAKYNEKENVFGLNNKHKDLCSMKCAKNDFENNNSPVSLLTTDAEKQMHSTDLDLMLQSDPGLQSSLLCEFALNSPNLIKNVTAKSLDPKLNMSICKESNDKNKQVCICGKLQVNPTLYFFTRKKHEHIDSSNPVIRKSKKSTNLVKYQNLFDEPTLKRPLSKCMLLGKYKLKGNKAVQLKTNIAAILKDTDTQVAIDKKHKSLQNCMTVTDYDSAVEKLLISICDEFKLNDFQEVNMKTYLSDIIKELYDIKLKDADIYPIKKLFEYLLEYWLNNTSKEDIKLMVKQSKSIDRQSNKQFANDQTTSNVKIISATKATQFRDIDEFIKANVPTSIICIDKAGNKNKLTYKVDDSYGKERRIQELEKVLKNTVYICDTIRSNKSRQTDIKITKKLIDNIGNVHYSNNINKSDENTSDSSNELLKIQETINNLIAETAMPADVAKELLGAYLDILRQNENIDMSSSTEESETEVCLIRSELNCDVQTESVQNKVSISISTKDFKAEDNKKENVDSNQIYLKSVLNKITTIFSINKENETKNIDKQHEVHNWDGIKFNNIVKDELGNVKTDNNYNSNSLVIDVSKYDLEHISMANNPIYKGKTAITMKLREKPPNSGETRPFNVCLKFANTVSCVQDNICYQSDSNKVFDTMTLDPQNIPDNPYIDNPYNTGLKPYCSSSDDFDKGKLLNKIQFSYCDSDATSKAHAYSENSMYDINNNEHNDSELPKIKENDPQSCFILSLKKGAILPKLHSKKALKENINSTQIQSKCSPLPENVQNNLSNFENIPKVIDENCILLLLENLTILSKNLPTLHKELNSLYIKLRKKRDKANLIKAQGLGLLGKIYHEESNIKCTKETEIQSEENQKLKTTIDVGTATDSKIRKTSSIKSLNVNKIDVDHKDLQTHEIITPPKNFYLERKHIFNIKNNNSSTQTTFSSLSSDEEVKRTDKAVSNQSWYRQMCTKDCAISTLIKYIVDSNENVQNFRFNSDQRHFNYKNTKNRKHSQKLRQDLIKEINLLSPSFKVSTQSQTEKKLRCLKDKNRDYNIYQLFLSQKYKIKRSQSLLKQARSDDLKTIYRCSSESCCSGLLSPSSPIRGPQAGFVSGTPGGRFAGWILESGGPLDTASRELGQAQLSVQQLQRLLEALELQQQAHHDTDVSLEGASPNVKKDRRKFGLRKKKSNSKCASVDLQPPHIDPSNSHMALSALTAPPSPGGGGSMPASAASLPIACSATRPQSLPGAEVLNAPASLSSLTPDQQLREDFTVLAKDLVASLKGVVATLIRERGRLRAGSGEGAPLLQALRTDLSTALQQNSELRSRLSRIHDASDLAEMSSMAHDCDQANRPFQHSLSYSSSCVSASEFFDAEEHDEDLKQNEILNANEAGVIELDGDSSSEAGSLSSEEGSASSDNSDAAMVSAEQCATRGTDGSGGVGGGGGGGGGGWTRRTRLPSPRPSPGGPSLWNLLYKNIGKDLSQVSMPVTINEPLNMLQRLCEELEYSELLDAAAAAAGGAERCALVAAFAVSAYAAAAHRAASKPFNPLLAETYECVRADRGFRFLAEQVSHHPPVSACHAESPRWVFWQEARIKTKFWGKSMEFQPAGRVHVTLLPSGDRYSWNKVTTCVHNLFGGQRWVDQYGDMHITCHDTDISCKLNFVKASSWSSSRHEVRGAVAAGGARLRLAGRWSEALYAGDPPAARCLWRPGAMPPEHELYYGFTRFAMELNELEPGMRDLLPHTDTRLRPDQRALEEGDVDAAEAFKHQLEQAQRERRRDGGDHAPAWFRNNNTFRIAARPWRAVRRRGRSRARTGRRVKRASRASPRRASGDSWPIAVRRRSARFSARLCFA